MTNAYELKCQENASLKEERNAIQYMNKEQKEKVNQLEQQIQRLQLDRISVDEVTKERKNTNKKKKKKKINICCAIMLNECIMSFFCFYFLV